MRKGFIFALRKRDARKDGFWGREKKREYFFRIACPVKKNCYFCTRFGRQMPNKA